MRIKIYDSNQRFQPSGYGVMSLNAGEQLQALGHEVFYAPSDEVCDVNLWIRPPHYIKQPEFNPNEINIFWTMHETETFDGWKSDWPQLLNKLQGVITPTQWNKGVFERAGVTVPIEVINLGVNARTFSGGRTYEFSILTVHDNLGSESSRENWVDTIRAYYRAFVGHHNHEVSLTIKSQNIKQPEYLAKLNDLQIRYDPQMLPPINVMDINLPTASLNNVYARHWMFIKNANREGWCLPLLEAMSCGLAVAFAELPVYEWTVGYKPQYTFKLGDIDGLARIMRHEFLRWKKQKGFITQFSWKRQIAEVARVLEKYVKS